MDQAQFKSIKSDLNKIFAIVNHTKILGRDKLVSKFEKHDKRIKNVIEIPKLDYEDTISSSYSQLLYSDTFKWESSDYESVNFDLGLEINVREDYYGARFFVSTKNNKYSPSFDMKPTEEILLDKYFQENDLIEFLHKFRSAYGDLVNLNLRGEVLVDDNYETDMDILIRSITDKLGE